MDNYNIFSSLKDIKCLVRNTHFCLNNMDSHLVRVGTFLFSDLSYGDLMDPPDHSWHTLVLFSSDNGLHGEDKWRYLGVFFYNFILAQNFGMCFYGLASREESVCLLLVDMSLFCVSFGIVVMLCGRWKCHWCARPIGSSFNDDCTPRIRMMMFFCTIFWCPLCFGETKNWFLW